MDYLTVAQAAEVLGVSQDAIYKRIQRGTIEHHKDSEGRVFVYLDASDIPSDTSTDASTDASDGLVVEVLREQVASLQEQLAAEREANRENRRLLAAALERIPHQLEAPQNTSPGERESPVSASEDSGSTSSSPPPAPEESRSWLRRFFGV